MIGDVCEIVNFNVLHLFFQVMMLALSLLDLRILKLIPILALLVAHFNVAPVIFIIQAHELLV
jgi:hypothetical protein